ncbi:carbohydrate ABC transporter permease [Actinomycetota bacterium]
MKKPKLKINNFINQIILILFSFTAIYPVFWIITTSLKTRDQYLENKIGISWPLTLESIKTALDSANFFRWTMNSVLITSCSVILVTIIAIAAAYALTKLKVNGKNFTLTISVALMAIPVIVILIPLYLLFAKLGLINSYFGIIIIYTAITAPFSVYLLVSFFREIPWEILEAGVIDGCNSFGVLTRIILPISGPPIASLIIVNALWIWNELLLALIFLPMDNAHTIMVGLTVHKSRYAIDIPVVVSGLLFASVPLLILYLVFQRFFTKGLMAGSLKG